MPKIKKGDSVRRVKAANERLRGTEGVVMRVYQYPDHQYHREDRKNKRWWAEVAVDGDTEQAQIIPCDHLVKIDKDIKLNEGGQIRLLPGE